MARTYRLHGLNVRSEIPLDEGALVRDGADPDVEVRWGERRPVPREPGPGQLLLRVERGGHVCVVVRTRDVVVLRYPGFCDCEIGEDGRSVRVHLDPRASDELAPIMVAGNALAVILTLWGEAVLHASAVDIGGSAVAFLGASGMGKSTLATLLCAHGAEIVSDDVLRVVVDEGRAWSFTGTTELRLRPHAAELATSFPPDATRDTFDRRVAVAGPRSRQDRLPLAAIVVPQPSREHKAVRIEPLSAAAGMWELLRFPRTIGWQVDEPLRTQFWRLAELAQIVPVHRAELPWGASSVPTLAPDLLRGLGIEAALPSKR